MLFSFGTIMFECDVSLDSSPGQHTILHGLQRGGSGRSRERSGLLKMEMQTRNLPVESTRHPNMGVARSGIRGRGGVG